MRWCGAMCILRNLAKTMELKFRTRGLLEILAEHTRDRSAKETPIPQ